MPRHYRRSSGISEFPSDSGLLLFDPLLNRLLAFNQAARLLWESIDVGVSLDGIAADFVAKYGISLATARRDIDAMIENWQALGLLGGDNRPVPVQAQDCTDWPQASPSAWRDTAIYTVRDKTFSLASEMPDSLAMMRRFFRHLETPDAEPGLRLEVRQTADGSPALLLNGREQFRTGDEAQLIGGISQAVLEYLHPGVEWLAMMHGGAATRNGRGLAFPATSGSGKTTLIAYLIAREGFTYLADDLIVLSAPSGHIVPWPMPLNIKEGSWTLLSRSHPGLHDAPVHDSFRGAARLLVAPSSSWLADPAPVQAIVFPRYAAGAAVKLTRIPAFEAITRLLSDRIWLGYPMTDHRIRAFLAWINATPAYSLVHGNVADAARCLEDLP